MTPTTNAWGYANDRREEYTDNGHYIDINRDFPYNRRDESCFSTISSRVVFKIFQTNNIIGSLTFHGGTEVIGYPWGSYLDVDPKHKNKGLEAPDHTMFDQIGKVMLDQSHVNKWKDLRMGDMIETVYP